jgi:hypothetical protein
LHGGEDNLCGGRVVHEIITGVSLDQVRQSHPGMFKILDSFNPNRSTGKFPEDIVSYLHGSPRNVDFKWPVHHPAKSNRITKFIFAGLLQSSVNEVVTACQVTRRVWQGFAREFLQSSGRYFGRTAAGAFFHITQANA